MPRVYPLTSQSPVSPSDYGPRVIEFIDMTSDVSLLKQYANEDGFWNDLRGGKFTFRMIRMQQ
jgi:hypothetical protein